MNGEPNIGELAGQIAAAGKPYLGDIAVVDRQVRSLISGIVTRWGQYAASTISKEAFANANESAVRNIATVMCGADRTFTPVEGWTGAADGQDAFLLRALNRPAQPSLVAEVGPSGVVAVMLMLQTYAVIDKAERSGDEQTYKDDLMEIVKEGTRLFMGFPSAAELEYRSAD